MHSVCVVDIDKPAKSINLDVKLKVHVKTCELVLCEESEINNLSRQESIAHIHHFLHSFIDGT